MRHALLCLSFSALLAAPALGADAENGKKPEPGTTVEMPLLMAPMSQDGKLLGYAYIVSKLVCTKSEFCASIRTKIAFIQDANIRDVNANPIGLANDPKTVDRDLLNTRMTANARRVVGDGKVANMVFLEIKFAPLHPKESTESLSTAPQTTESAAGAATAPAQENTNAAAGNSASPPSATSKPATKGPH